MNAIDPAEHILQRLRTRAVEHADEIAVSFADKGPAALTHITWSELDILVRRARAGYAASRVRRGHRVILSPPTSPTYLALLLGAFASGIVPATLHGLDDPALTDANDSDLPVLVAALAPRLVIANTTLSLPLTEIAAPDSILAAGDRPGEEPLAYTDADQPAYVQFSSGSTRRPRGLALTWSAIHANLTQISRRAPVTERDHVVSWLPMYHDMGLFGGLLTPLYVGARVTLLDTRQFLSNPLLWLRVVDAVRATITVTPPSALQTCIKMLERRPPALDLSSLEQIICGAEPVSRHFVASVADKLTRFGLRRNALRPVYGLAEATLAVSFPPAPREPLIDRLEREPFETNGVARPAAVADGDDCAWVSGGTALEGVEVRIVDQDGATCPERHVGRVLFRSPSQLAGTIEHGVFVPRQEGWVETGDLGYVADGEIFITGRSKDIIIKHGRNYSPDRIEELACTVEGVRRAAAFGIYDDEMSTEKIVVLAEGRPRDLADAAARDSMRAQIRQALGRAGYSADVVSFVDRGSLPMTTSGKVRRQLSREMFERQSLLVS